MNTLKRLGDTFIRPMNTLNRLRHANPADEPSNKRQKTDAETESRLHKSPFFPPTPQEKISSSVYTASQDDPHEILSISSIGKSSTVAATVQEFRSTNSKGPGSSRPRNRRSRQMIRDDPTATELKSPTSRSINSESPDVLAVNEIPPANVKSDVLGRQQNGKRSRPTKNIEPPVKRPKTTVPQDPIDISEDELQAPPRNGVLNAKKKKTNFTNLDEGRLGRITNKGDIKSTEFWSSKSSNAKFLEENPRIRLKAAVSGKFTWRAQRSQAHELSPCASAANEQLDSFKFKLGNDGDDDVQWLQIKFDKLLHVRHAASRSPFVVISRSKCTDRPPKLYIEFEDIRSSLKFIQCLPPTKLIEDSDPTTLEKMFNYAQRQAEAQATPVNGATGIKVSPRQRQQLVVELPAESTRRRVPDEMKSPRREKLTDKLVRSAKEPNATTKDIIEEEIDDLLPTRWRPRRVAREPSPIIPLEFFDRWSTNNPSWRQRWTKSLVYPPTGKNRATVDADDILRLDEGEFLNDNIITFYLRYLQLGLEAKLPSMGKRVHIFSSFFFETLKSAKKYEGVKGWTAKIDLFSYDYIVVPVNEHAHWYLAIICNPAMTLPAEKRPQINALKEDGEVEGNQKTASPQMPSVERGVESISLEDHTPYSTTPEPTVKIPKTLEVTPAVEKKKSRKSVSLVNNKPDPSEPRIITLDSLGKAHSPTCRILRDYLGEEAKDKKRVELAISPPGMTGKGIPEQDNFCDCGVFVLGYMEAFLRDPDETYRKLLHKEHVKWNINPSKLRNRIREVLFDLQDEQQKRTEREREVKRAAWLDKKVSLTPNQPSLPPLQRASSQGPLLEQPASEVSKLVSFPSPPVLKYDASNDRIQQQIVSSPAKIQRPEASEAEFPRPELVRPLLESSSDVPTERAEGRKPSASPTQTNQSKWSGLVSRALPKLVSPLADSSQDSAERENQPSVSPNVTYRKTPQAGQSIDLSETRTTVSTEAPVHVSVEVSDAEEAGSPTRRREEAESSTQSREGAESPTHRRKIRKKKRKKKNRDHVSAWSEISDPLSGNAIPEPPQYDSIKRSDDLM